MLKEEIKIFGVEITSSLVMVKDSHKSVCMHKYPCLYKRCCNRHYKNIVKHQDDLLEFLINIYRALQNPCLQVAAGMNWKLTVGSDRGQYERWGVKDESSRGCLLLIIMMSRDVKNK